MATTFTLNGKSQTVDVSLDFQNGKLIVTATPDVVHLSVKKGEHVEWEVGELAIADAPVDFVELANAFPSFKPL